MRIRSLVNAELVATVPGNEEGVIMQIGAQTWFEANKVVKYMSDGEQVADIHLVNGNILEGVSWGPKYFENHGVPESNAPDRSTIFPVPTPDRTVDSRPLKFKQ
jgi:hypothetical protein